MRGVRKVGVIATAAVGSVAAGAALLWMALGGAHRAQGSGLLGTGIPTLVVVAGWAAIRAWRAPTGESRSVEFPSMRAWVVDALTSLSDRAYQQREWGIFDEERGYYDDLTLNIHVLYDDCCVLPDPRRAIGSVLYAEDVKPLRRLDEVLGPMIDDLGDSDDSVYTEDPRWAAVVEAAGRALVVMHAKSS